MRKVFSIDIDKISVEEENDGDFLRLKLYAISDKPNRNGSEFVRESFESGINPLESEIEQAFISRTSISPSKYADSNHFEWFAENYALDKMGRSDLVSKEARELIDKIEKKSSK